MTEPFADRRNPFAFHALLAYCAAVGWFIFVGARLQAQGIVTAPGK